MKKQVAIGTKLLTSVGALLLMFIALAVGALYSTGGLENALNTTASTGHKMEMTGEMANQLSLMRANPRGMIVYPR